MEDERVLRVAFRNILKMGNKANTYKFALAKFLLEYSNKFTHDELKLAVKTKKLFDVQYSEIAKFFLKFYWHQECKYRIQHSDPKYTPNVIQSIRKFFGTKYMSSIEENPPSQRLLHTSSSSIFPSSFSEFISLLSS